MIGNLSLHNYHDIRAISIQLMIRIFQTKVLLRQKVLNTSTTNVKAMISKFGEYVFPIGSK